MIDPAETIIVAGSARSGTTWLGNIIAGDEIRIVFEPFDYRHVPEAEGLGLRPYFNPNKEYPQWRPFIENVLTGAINNEWVDRDRNRLNEANYSNKILVKEIRANGILAWIDKNFHSQIVYIVRHPYSVIASRLRLKWETHIDAFLSQPQLISDYLTPYEHILKSAETEVQKHAVMWCVENLVPLSQITEYKWIFCFYENFTSNPDSEIQRILNTLNLKYTDSRQKAFSEATWTSYYRNANRSEPLFNGGIEVLSNRDKEDIQDILNCFNIKLYDN